MESTVSGLRSPLSTSSGGSNSPTGYNKSTNKKQDELEEHAKTWRETFDLIAENMDYIMFEQVEPLLNSLGFQLEDKDSLQYGYLEKICFEDFFNICMRKQNQTDDQVRLKAAFKAFDVNKCGCFSTETLRHILCYLGEKMREEDVDKIFGELDIEEDDDDIEYLELMYIMGHKHLAENE